jgi:DNA-binding transcriptional LysR family regulator
VCVALAATHPLARLKSIPLEKVSAEPLVGFRRKAYPEYYRNLQRIFAPLGVKPRIAVECDSGSSLLVEVEAGRGIALSVPVFELVTGKRLVYRPLTGTKEVGAVGIARATNGDVTPAGENSVKSCGRLRVEALRLKQNRESHLVLEQFHAKRLL